MANAWGAVVASNQHVVEAFVALRRYVESLPPSPERDAVLAEVERHLRASEALTRPWRPD